jgi:tRNA modification GTPase
VLYLFDAVADSTTEVDAMQKELQLVARSWMMIGNKVDDVDAVPQRAAAYGLNDAVYISAKQDLGLEVLKTALTEKVISGGVNTENTIVTNARHYQSLQKLSETLMAIRTGMKENVPGDLLSIDIRQCLYHLGEITGQISNEDQLDFIFSKFCIGK